MIVTKTPPPPPVPDPNERFTLSDLTRDELFLLGHLLDSNCTEVNDECSLSDRSDTYETRKKLLKILQTFEPTLGI